MTRAQIGADYWWKKAVTDECLLTVAECTLNSPGNTHSAWLAKPMWTDSGVKSAISVHELIST